MAKPKKTGHKSHDKVMQEDWEAKQGHNSGGINPEMQKIYNDYEALEASSKALNKDKKTLRNRAKEEFGVALRVFNIELSMRKLDPVVRDEIEQGHRDLKSMLGYQMALNLSGIVDSDSGNYDPILAARNKVHPVADDFSNDDSEAA